jgi:hypothetical protein
MAHLFGDATTAMPTPATGQQGPSSGITSGIGSPMPYLDIRNGGAATIPGLDIDPPDVQIENGKPNYTGADRNNSSTEADGEGLGGWISRMKNRMTQGNGSGGSGSGSGNPEYRPLTHGADEDDDDEERRAE